MAINYRGIWAKKNKDALRKCTLAFSEARVFRSFHGETVRAKALRGSGWTFLAYGTSQAMRLGSNLILTRLLFPELFGLMALVSVFMQGLAMFSDVGIGPGVIQSKRSEDLEFQNTAWTIQVCRGVILWLLACFLGYPLGIIYQEPLLSVLLPVAGLSAFFSGFNPTSLFVASKKLSVGRLSAVDLLSQLVSLAAMIPLAFAMKNVWPLVLGPVAGAVSKLLFALWLIPGERNSFRLNIAYMKELTSFGKWIFLGTALTFLVTQGDRLVMGLFVDSTFLGIYSLATMLVGVICSLNSRLSQSILFPAYASTNTGGHGDMRLRVGRVRLATVLVMLVPLGFMIAWGDLIVRAMYDFRYYDAGWMLQVLAVGHAIHIGTSAGPLYISKGDSRSSFFLVLARSILLLLGMAIGGSLGGSGGIVFGIAATSVMMYPFEVFFSRRHGVWIFGIDALAFGIVAVFGSIALLRV